MASPQPKFLYLPKNQWSSRFEGSFYTVRVDGFQRFDKTPEEGSSSSSNTKTNSSTVLTNGKIGGHSHHPAFYYKVVLNRSQTSREMWRRFSQFQWLYHQVKKNPPPPPDANAAEHQPEEPLHLPLGTCWPFQSEQLGEKRVELLNSFLDDMLSRPGYASHRAVVTFLELDETL